MNRFFSALISALLLGLALPDVATAQSPGEAAAPPADQIEALRQRLDEQAAQIGDLRKTVDRQTVLIEQQQKLLGDLEKRSEVPPPEVATVAPTPASAPASKHVQFVENGFGKIKFNGLLQGWFAAGDQGFKDTFRLRRAELMFTGDITSKARWTILIDPAKALSLNNTYTFVNGTRVVEDTSVNQASRILQDAFITYDFHKNVRVDFGQYRIPLSLEGLQSSANLETVERALFLSDRARGGNYGDIWDIGLTVRGPITKNADYWIGFFNGTGENANDVDRSDQKGVVGRFIVRPPFIEGLQIGGSGAWSNGSEFATSDRPRHDRIGGELLYRREGFTFKSEVMTGEDADLHRVGYYVHAGYRFGNVEPIFRFDSWDPDTRLDTNAANVQERDYIVGFNYYLTENNVKVQFNYMRKTFVDGLVPSRNLLLVNLQTSW